MKFLVLPELDYVNAALSGFDLDDTILEGKLEVFTTKMGKQDKSFAKSVQKRFKRIRSSDSGGSPISPLGFNQENSTRKLLVNLITTMNASYPDYDFSLVDPSDFKKIKVEKMNELINARVAIPITRKRPDFREKLWKAMDKEIDPKKCEVFCYTPGFPDGEALWAMNFFFFNKKMKRVAFFISHLKSKRAYQIEQEEEDEEYLESAHGTPAGGYVDTGLLDMDQYGMKELDMPVSQWFNSPENAFGSLSQVGETFIKVETSDQVTQKGHEKSYILSGN